MTITLELKPEVETRLRRKAERGGRNVADYLLDIANQEAQEDDEGDEGSTTASSEQAQKNKAALAALRTWREQNATYDPKVLEQRQLDWEELKQALNESHTSDRVLFP